MVRYIVIYTDIHVYTHNYIHMYSHIAIHGLPKPYKNVLHSHKVALKLKVCYELFHFMVHYLTRDLRRRLGLLKQGVTHYLHYHLNDLNTEKNPSPAVT